MRRFGTENTIVIMHMANIYMGVFVVLKKTSPISTTMIADIIVPIIFIGGPVILLIWLYWELFKD